MTFVLAAWVGAFLLLTWLNFRQGGRDLLYPPFLFCLVWFMALGVYATHPLAMDQVASNTILIFLSGAMMYSVGGAIAANRFRRYVDGMRVTAVPSGPVVSVPLPMKHVMLAALIMLLPMFLQEMQRFSTESGLDSFFIGARVAMSAAANSGEVNTFSNPLLSNLPTMAIFVSSLYLIEKRPGRRETLWYALSLTVAIAYAILTTGRSTLITIVVGSTCIYLLKHRTVRVRNIVLVGAITMATMTVMVFVMKDLSLYALDTTTAIAWFFLFSYIVGPLAAFDHVVNDPTVVLSPVNHTFSPIMKAVAAVSGMGYQAPPLVDDNVFVPFNINVYTVYKFYYVDFGLAGMLLVVGIIGFVQTYLFARARGGHAVFMFLFAVSMYPLLTSFVDDQYFQFIFHLKTVVFGVFYFLVLRRLNVMPSHVAGVRSALPE